MTNQEKVITFLKKIADSNTLLQFEAKKDRYSFQYKNHDLFFRQSSSGTMFFGVTKANSEFIIPEQYRELFYKVVYPEKALDEILALPQKSKKLSWFSKILKKL